MHNNLVNSVVHDFSGEIKETDREDCDEEKTK